MYTVLLNCPLDNVTLHVSVWVEIFKSRFSVFVWMVTLHVSVWVEIQIRVRQVSWYSSHAPRERVSWNDRVGYQRLSWVSHAPRERVSWNNGLHLHRCSGDSHAPRERVSWNLQECRQSRPSYPSRSTWACELKYQRMLCIWNDRGSRSTWACELKWKFDCKTSWWTQVTLHVSVWVEIIIVTIGSIIRMSRSTWACELKSRYLF